MKSKTSLLAVVLLLLPTLTTNCGLFSSGSSSGSSASSSGGSDTEKNGRAANATPAPPKADHSVTVADIVNWANADGASDVRNWIKNHPAPPICIAPAPPDDAIPDEVKRNEVDNAEIAQSLTDGLTPVLKLFGCEKYNGLILYKGATKYAGTLKGGRIAVTADKAYYSKPFKPDEGTLRILRIFLAREVFNQILPDEKLGSGSRALKMDYLAALASLEIDNDPKILGQATLDVIHRANRQPSEYFPMSVYGGVTEHNLLPDLFAAIRQEWEKRK